MFLAQTWRLALSYPLYSLRLFAPVLHLPSSVCVFTFASPALTKPIPLQTSVAPTSQSLFSPQLVLVRSPFFERLITAFVAPFVLVLATLSDKV